MEAILKFNLPEDTHEFKMAVDGAKWASLAWQFDQWLRSNIKYDESLSEEQHNVYIKVREELYRMMNNEGITFDD